MLDSVKQSPEKRTEKNPHIQFMFQKKKKASPIFSEAEVFYKKVFLEISQNSQENTFARASFLIKLQLSSYRNQSFNLHSKSSTKHLRTTAS